MSGRTSLTHRAETALDWLRLACMVVASASLLVLVVTFGWLVFGRYVLNVTPTWVEQLALVLICYIVFLGAVTGVRDDTHLGVTIFRDFAPIVVQKALIVFIDLVLALFGALMFVAGSTLVQFGWDSLLPMLNIPESFRTLPITLCGALIFLVAGTRAVLRLMTFPNWQVPHEMEDAIEAQIAHGVEQAEDVQISLDAPRTSDSKDN
jgi:TRAP-type C4-dicarboxylate transport system permease small subunit